MKEFGFKANDWDEVYEEVIKDVPPNRPKELGKPVSMRTKLIQLDKVC